MLCAHPEIQRHYIGAPRLSDERPPRVPFFEGPAKLPKDAEAGFAGLGKTPT